MGCLRVPTFDIGSGDQSVLNCLAMTNHNRFDPAIKLMKERPDSADAQVLIAELEAQLDPLYAEESRHGYSVDKLLREKVDFFVLRSDNTPAACCGIQFFGTDYGEVKRMYVRPAYRGLGLGYFMLEHLCEVARQRKVTLLRLETGIFQAQAITLYERFGFYRIPPFGDYHFDPMSVFFEKKV